MRKYKSYLENNIVSPKGSFSSQCKSSKRNKSLQDEGSDTKSSYEKVTVNFM